MAYILDADVFIQASNQHYRFEFCPAFWEWIDLAQAAGKLYSIDKVKEELVRGTHGLLLAWVSERPHLFLHTNNDKTYQSLRKVAEWASKNYKTSAYETFFTGGDFILVGFALANDHTVVTQEAASGGGRVKIPNACQAMGVNCINTWELLMHERPKFILQKRSEAESQ